MASNFSEPCGCALALAIKEEFGTDNVKELLCRAELDGRLWKHDLYMLSEYNSDRRSALSNRYQPEKIIRTILLTKIEDEKVKPIVTLN